MKSKKAMKEKGQVFNWDLRLWAKQTSDLPLLLARALLLSHSQFKGG